MRIYPFSARSFFKEQVTNSEANQTAEIFLER